MSLVVFGLGDSDAYLASSLRSKFPINLFNLSDRHNRIVDLKSKPYKRTLHIHFARCITRE